MVLKLYTSAVLRLQALRDPALRDRGEGPIPHVVMVAVMAAGAIVVGGMVVLAAKAWIEQIPKTR